MYNTFTAFKKVGAYLKSYVKIKAQSPYVDGLGVQAVEPQRVVGDLLRLLAAAEHRQALGFGELSSGTHIGSISILSEKL